MITRDLKLSMGTWEELDHCMVYTFWGEDEDDTTCVYLRFLEYENYLLLQEVEVRLGWRGNHLSDRMIDLIQQRFDKPMFSMGTFTPQGYAARRNKLPILNNTEPIIRYTDKGFVSDWDKKFTLID